jgi:hypothetical protein
MLNVKSAIFNTSISLFLSKQILYSFPFSCITATTRLFHSPMAEGMLPYDKREYTF